jgi:predicted dienelactone hydrolase
MKNHLLLVAIILFASPVFAQVPNKSVQTYEAGYEQLRIVDEARKRPVHLDIWYPAAAKEKEHNYGFSKGTVAFGASLTAKQLPIILLSHGAMGAALNYSWLAEYLSRRGYVVLGVSHFGESMVFGPDSIDPASVSRFGDRTRDLNFALEYLIEKSKYAPNLDASRVGAIGHSSGGATVLMIGGAEFSAKNLAEYCGKKAPINDKGCAYPRSVETDEQRIVPMKSTRPFKALVALDPAVGQGFAKNALKSIKTPTLIIGSVKNDFLPFDSHAGYLAKRIKNSELVKLDNGEGHFIYLDECNLPVKVMGIPLCTDGKGVDRNAAHLKLADTIEQFLSRQFSVGK